ncbi:MAG TPA: FAD-binding oxidoreductase [Actinomycetes bacterium]
MTGSVPDWDALQGAIAGEVVLPGSPGYELARKPAIASFDGFRPRAVVRCASPEDVAATIALAGRSGLHAVPRSGGHCFAGRSSTSGVVLDVTPMRSVMLAHGQATIGAGARLGEVYDALAAQGLTIAAGCGPTVGIAGLVLGGGLGILGRRHGLTCDQLLAARVVLADGRVVDCDQHHEPELFWALRGAGGGNFGVVTSLVFRTLPAGSATSFHLRWPHARAAAVLDAWQHWSPDAPDELAASLLLTAAGRADPVVHLIGAMQGSESDTTALLDQLVVRAGADPEAASRTHSPYRETKRQLAELGDQLAEPPPDGPAPPGHPFSKSEFFRRTLPAEAITALLRNFQVGAVPGQARELDFSPWGGAYNRVPEDATAFAHRGERFLLKHAVVVDPGATPAETEAARAWLRRSWATVHPWGSGRVYPNFPDPDLDDWARAYHAGNLERLLRAKRRYDPDGFFRFHQSIPSHAEAR